MFCFQVQKAQLQIIFGCGFCARLYISSFREELPRGMCIEKGTGKQMCLPFSVRLATIYHLRACTCFHSSDGDKSVCLLFLPTPNFPVFFTNEYFCRHISAQLGHWVGLSVVMHSFVKANQQLILSSIFQKHSGECWQEQSTDQTDVLDKPHQWLIVRLEQQAKKHHGPLTCHFSHFWLARWKPISSNGQSETVDLEIAN